MATQAELKDWERELSAHGIAFTPVNKTPIEPVVVFRDPVQLEFWLPAE